MFSTTQCISSIPSYTKTLCLVRLLWLLLTQAMVGFLSMTPMFLSTGERHIGCLENLLFWIVIWMNKITS
jgi:hypothetical protein